MKWVALALLIIGVALAAKSYTMNATSSFEDGTFMFQMIAGIVGAGSIAAAVAIFAIALFMSA